MLKNFLINNLQAGWGRRGRAGAGFSPLAALGLAALAVFAPGGLAAGGPAPRTGAATLPANHADCEFFGPNRERFLETGLSPLRPRPSVSVLTTDVVARLQPAVRRAVTGSAPAADFGDLGTIDRHLAQAWADAGVTPAKKTNDFEFARRVTLDLTGRVPTPERLLAFVSDPAPDKRARLVDELLETEAWVDKWTMYFGDLFKNADRTTQIRRYPDGRNAFHRWIRQSLASGTPYHEMARELITAAGDHSYNQGQLNWVVGGLVTGGPRTGQDNYDQQAANVAETFLGISHMNCVLCHDGRGHLDGLSLWGAKATRLQAWQFASHFSKTVILRPRVNENSNQRYYQVADRPGRTPYPLNTDSGNRPPRQPIGALASVTPKYPFSGGEPAPGENYRVALAREIVQDVQFSRALVNYLWKEFFGIGLVEPVNQFDPARLDPDNPPPEPWTLQPSHPRLLNDMAQEFMANGYDLKALMRQLVNSEAYQLSSRYEGEWKMEWEPLFARKFVRRLWAEELHDALVQTSRVWTSYPVNGLGFLTWAMQFPEPANMPGPRYPAASFLDSFQRGDRDENERRSDTSAVQALNLMNHSFVVTRAMAFGRAPSETLAQLALNQPDDQAVDTLFLTILSRHPSGEERAAAVASLQSGERQHRMEDLTWALYNKVDFLFNY